MLITPDDSFRLALPPTQGRSDGIHLSTIIRDLDSFFRKREGDKDEPIDEQYSLRGFSWERILCSSFRDTMGETGEEQLVSQIEIYEDTPIGRIYMTLDGWVLRVRVDLHRLREYKATEKTSNKLDKPGMTQADRIDSFKTNFRTWDWQIQCYLRALGRWLKIELLECELYVWWVRGDYKFHEGAAERKDALERRTRKYLLTYQRHELEETWMMIVNHAMTMRSRGKL